MSSHQDSIREQFTKQAIPFSNAPGIKDKNALGLLVEFTGCVPIPSASSARESSRIRP